MYAKRMQYILVVRGVLGKMLGGVVRGAEETEIFAGETHPHTHIHTYNLARSRQLQRLMRKWNSPIQLQQINMRGSTNLRNEINWWRWWHDNEANGNFLL